MFTAALTLALCRPPPRVRALIVLVATAGLFARANGFEDVMGAVVESVIAFVGAYAYSAVVTCTRAEVVLSVEETWAAAWAVVYGLALRGHETETPWRAAFVIVSAIVHAVAGEQWALEVSKTVFAGALAAGEWYGAGVVSGPVGAIVAVGALVFFKP